MQKMESSARDNSGAVIAAMIAASLGILILGAFNLFNELWDGFNTAMLFYEPMGPLSGHVVSAYSASIVGFLVLFRWKALARQSLKLWTAILLTSIVISSLLETTPFLHLFIE
ncbi:MAG: hypothetical protein ACYC55_06595 [Candidatus Geothermincolia bacterium]